MLDSFNVLLCSAAIALAVDVLRSRKGPMPSKIKLAASVLIQAIGVTLVTLGVAEFGIPLLFSTVIILACYACIHAVLSLIDRA